MLMNEESLPSRVLETGLWEKLMCGTGVECESWSEKVSWAQSKMDTKKGGEKRKCKD